jgi:hypothetical protein
MSSIVKPLGFQSGNLPGIEYVRIEPSDSSEFGVHVVVKLAGQSAPLSFGAREFVEVMNGLNDMVPCLRVMANTYAGPDETPDEAL